ncbi:MAG: S8/S53 family peptidase [Rhodothermaceae bacterium]
MKRLIFVSIILCFSATLFASGSKCFIYFKDKGNVQLLKSDSKITEQILNSLSDETILRRTKILGDNIITEADLPVNAKYIKTLEDEGIHILRVLKWFNAVSAYLTEEQIQKIAKFDFVEKVEGVKKLKTIIPIQIDKKITSLNKSSDITNSKYNYGTSIFQMQLSDVPALHNLDITGSGVIIGLIDAGFKTSGVPSLEGRTVIDRYDFIQNDNVTENQSGDAWNQDSHGTAVFSACGGFDEGNLVSPAFNAKFLLAKTENVASEENVEEDNFVAACEWMESKGAQIVSSSLGYNEFDIGQKSYTYNDMDGNTAVTTKAYNKLFDLGVITINSAGNDGSSTWKYIASPADAYNCISVGAVDRDNNIASFSSYGPTFDGRPKPEITAMGYQVYLNNPSGKYYYSNGTSFSAPIVAGITGQLLSVFPHLTNSQVRHIIINSGDHPFEHDSQRGYGLISAKRAVEFPNLENVSGNFKLHKAFVNSNGVKSGSAKVHITENGNSETFDLLTGNKDYKFYADLQNYNNSNLEVYFTYTDNQNNQVREPVSGSYKLKYGELNITSVEDDFIVKNEYPESFILNQNYPNPFNPTTTISYSIKEEGNVKLEIYNILGQKIKTLVDKYQNSGSYEIKIDNSDMKNLSSGIYFYRLFTNGSSQTKKMILLK